MCDRYFEKKKPRHPSIYFCLCANLSFSEPPFSEYGVLVVVCVVLLGGWFHLSISILNEMCAKLKIKPFTIPYKKQ